MPVRIRRGLRRHGLGAAMYLAVPVFLAMAGLASPASADYKRGVRALGMLDYARALAEFRSAVADGDLRALFEIGLIYERGHGVPADPAEAARWYRKAAREATGPAPRALARRALARVEGKDAPPPAVASLPVRRQKEAPVPKPPARVEAKAAPPPASPPAARWDIDEGLAAYYRGDYAAALREFRPLAEQGHAAAQHNLGVIYEKGQGVKRDYAEAVKWFRKAAEQGHVTAQGALGFMYEMGRGVPKDTAEAVKWYRQAADRGNAKAKTRHGLIHGRGRGVPADPAEAARPSPKPIARVAAKVAPPLTPSPPVIQEEEAPAPRALARVAAKVAPPSPALPPAVLPERTRFQAGLYGDEPPIFAMVLAPAERPAGGRPVAGELAYGLANVTAKDEPAEARLWSLRQGRDLFQQGRYEEATPFIEKALELSDRQLGPDHAETGALLHDLAKLLRIQGRNAEAEPLFKRSADVFEKALGAENPRVAGSLDSLAGLYLVQGRLGDAEPLYGRSLAIREKALGAAHPLVAASLNNLAELYRGQGRFAEAEPLHKRSLAISEKALGAAHPIIGLILSNLTVLYRAQGRDAEAESLRERSLEILLHSGQKSAERSAPAWPPGLL